MLDLMLGRCALAGLALLSIGCRSAPREPAATSGPLPSPVTTQTPDSTAAATPARIVGSFRVLPMPADANVFGLVWHRGAWAIGTAYTDTRNALELRTIDRDAIGSPIRTIEQSGYPDALVPAHSGEAWPWVLIEARDHDFRTDGRVLALDFEGRSQLPLALPSDEPAIRESSLRFAWRPGSTIGGAAVWTTTFVRRLSDAELAKLRKNAEAAEKRGLAVDFSPYQSLAYAPRAYGGGPSAFEGPRVPNDGMQRLGWQTVAVGPRGWVAAHWIDRAESTAEDAPVEQSILLHWFDDPTKLRTRTEIRAPAGTYDGDLVLDRDGVTYLVADRSSPGVAHPAHVVVTFGADAGAMTERVVATRGWVGTSRVAFSCGERTWLVTNPYADGTDTIEVVELVPEGPLSAPIEIVRRRDPAAAPDVAGGHSRPGRVLYGACGDDRAAIVTTVALDADSGSFSGLLLAEWTTRPAG